MSCSSPTTAHCSGSPSKRGAKASIAALTAWQWRRNPGASTHSVKRVHASSRESRTDMVVTLAERPLPATAAGTHPRHMEKFFIEGGQPLSGEVVPAGNKNAALPILAAAALTSDEVVIGNVPRIRDVETMLELLRALGARVEHRNDHEVVIQASDLPEPHAIDRRLSGQIRASFLPARPLPARLGAVEGAPARGHVIRRRRLD